MAVGTGAVEAVAQLVVGELEGVFPLALQGLQIQLAFQVQLVRLQLRLPDHGQQKGQQAGGIVGGAFEANHQGILQGIGPQPSPSPFHQIGQGLSIEIAAAAGHQAGQQLVGTATALGIGAAAAPDRQPGRENRRPLAPQQPHRQATGQAEGLSEGRASLGLGHAGTASRM